MMINNNNNDNDDNNNNTWNKNITIHNNKIV